MPKLAAYSYQIQENRTEARIKSHQSSACLLKLTSTPMKPVKCIREQTKRQQCIELETKTCATISDPVFDKASLHSSWCDPRFSG